MSTPTLPGAARYSLPRAMRSVLASTAAQLRPVVDDAPPLTRYCPHQPTAKQQQALELDAREVLFGGAAGGGKSDWLLMGALQHVHVPGYAAVLFRRTFQDLNLPGALMDRAAAWLGGTAARWNGQDKRWTFPSGATISFGYLEHEQDKLRYQSAEFQYIGFDELTQFSESQYRYLFSRLRRVGTIDAPLRIRAASNPGGPGHEWVRQRFLVEGDGAERIFVPARLDDNPHLDHAEYLRSLGELDQHTRQQLEAGDWDARPDGHKFKREWFEIVGEAPADALRVRFWDLAATEPKPGRDPDWTAGARVAARGGQYWIEDVQRLQGTPFDVEARVKQTAETDGREIAVRMEQEPGSGGVNTIATYQRRVLAGWDFAGVRTTGSKELRANPVSSAAQAGNVKLVRGPWITAFLDEIAAFPHASHDDQVDALSGAVTALVDAAAPYTGATGGTRPALLGPTQAAIRGR